MAINPTTEPNMVGRITAPDADYPYGSSKDESAPGAGDGTPYYRARANDIFGFQQALLSQAGIVPNGTADSVSNPQYMQALAEMITGRVVNYAETGSSMPDNYILDAASGLHYKPAAVFQGMEVRWVPQFTNTSSAATLAIEITSPVPQPIRRPGNVALVAGDILAGREQKLVYRVGYFELDMTGRTEVKTFTTSGNYIQPMGVKSIRVTVVGGGGSGATSTDGPGEVGGGGGGGATVVGTYRAAEVGPIQTVVVGAGGPGTTFGVPGLNGNPGGNSSFGSLIFARGGGEGTTSLGGVGWPDAASSGGDFIVRGDDGGVASNPFGKVHLAGTGGGTMLSPNARPEELNGGNGAQRSARSGAFPGGGGGGGEQQGLNGADGVVIIEEFY